MHLLVIVFKINGMIILKDSHKHTSTLKDTSLMPLLFVGHGTPMNAIEHNRFSLQWKELSNKLPRPKAILCISAHWEKAETSITAMEHPETIHDFGGFPRELYMQQYPAPGSAALAETIIKQVKEISANYDWGLDHGTWSVLKHIYPDADIPVVQLSIDRKRSMQEHYELGKALRFLRREGVLIMGSGNMVHNLWLARADENGFNNNFAYNWAIHLNNTMKEHILSGNHEPLINYHELGKDAELAVTSEEHYIPLLYVLGAQEPGNKINIFNDEIVAGSLSMTSLIIEETV